MRRFVGLLCALVVIVGCDTAHNPTTSPLSTAPAAIPTLANASTTTPPISTEPLALSTQIDSLTVAAPYKAQPYRRAMFGKDEWIDANSDCHNTRAEVLMQETTA